MKTETGTTWNGQWIGFLFLLPFVVMYVVREPPTGEPVMRMPRVRLTVRQREWVAEVIVPLCSGDDPRRQNA